MPKTYAKNYGSEIIYNFTLKFFLYLNLWAINDTALKLDIIGVANTGFHIKCVTHVHMKDLVIKILKGGPSWVMLVSCFCSVIIDII